MRSRLITVLLTVLFLLAGGTGVAAARGGDDDHSGSGHGGHNLPELITLPVGFRPEGVSIAGSKLFVGSVSTGAIWRHDLRTDTGAILVAGSTDPNAPAAAIGTEVDSRGRLWVAGGATGKGKVYDARTGEMLAEWQFVTPPASTFINDVVVTHHAAYFTDSRGKFLHVVPIGKHGALDKPPTALEVNGEFVLDATPGANNFNGIEASESGRTLLAVQTVTASLFNIDPTTGIAQRVDLGGYPLTNGDGLLREGRTLYVVQNRLNQIAKFRLNRSFTAGTLVDTITAADLPEGASFDVPTTVAATGKWLYAVNARFGIPNPDTATYTIVRVRR